MAYDTTRQFPQTFVDFFTRMQRQYSFQPIFLGGTTGSNGGTGGNPGGFTGKLPQTQVCYDTTEAASSGSTTSGSIASLVDNLNRIRYDIRHIQEGWIPISTGLSWTSGSLTASGGTVGPGTASRIAKFITTTTIGDSYLIGPAANLLTLESSSGSLTLTAEITGTAIVRSATPNIVGGAFGATPGDARGTGAVDLQMSRTTAQQVANGNYSAIIGGNNCTASGVNSIAGGASCTASGTVSIALGNGSRATASSAVCIGSQGQATAAGAVALGDYATATGINSFALGGSGNTSEGDYAVAMGRFSKIDAAHDGAFLFADHTNEDFNSAAADEFAVRARGGVRWAYDDTHYCTVLVSSSGLTTINPNSDELALKAKGVEVARTSSTDKALIVKGTAHGIGTSGSGVAVFGIGEGSAATFASIIYGTSNPAFAGYKANGNFASPSVVSSGDFLGIFSGRGYCNGAWPASANGSVSIVANENFTTTSGTRVEIRTTANGATSSTVTATFASAGHTFTPAVTFTAAPILSTMTAGWLPYMGASKEIVGSANATLDASGNALFKGIVNFSRGDVDGTLGATNFFSAPAVPTSYLHKISTSHSGDAQYNKWILSLCDGTAGGFTDMISVVNYKVGIRTNTPQAQFELTHGTTTITAETDYALSVYPDATIRLVLGCVPASNYSFIQSYDPGTSWSTKPLVLQPNGGDVIVTGTFGCNGASAQTRLTVTGSRGGNAALASLLTQLAAFGFITDNTTA